MVRFKLNKQLDIVMASQFLGYSRAGVDFGRSVWQYYPELRNAEGSEIKLIQKSFDSFYLQNKETLLEKKKLFQKEWKLVEGGFIKETISLFNGYSFPDGEYIANLSTINCNPRFLHNKTFQVFYRTDDFIGTISHELMHFIFYAYTEDKLNDLVTNLDTNSGLWWDVAEIFNNVILSTDKYKGILRNCGDVGYPNHQELIKKAKELYKQDSNIDDFIRKLFDLLMIQ